MKRIQDVIRETEERLFVGRKQELAIMERKLLDPNITWRMLHFYGPAGIGKTSLLRSFIRKAGDYEVFYFDRMGGLPNADEFLLRLTEMLKFKGYQLHLEQDHMTSIAEFLNELAVQKGVLVLIFDTYEKWEMLDNWLREVWIPMLVPQIRICSAGQFPLNNMQIKVSGWEGLIRNVQLQPLSKVDVKRYARIRGIEDPQELVEIERFSAGVPLAISLSCDLVLQHGAEKLKDSVVSRETIGQLVGKLLEDMNNEYFQNLLDITCLLWRFDQDLLSDILGEPISNESFRRFCRLPFITVCERGWSLHDAVRQWTRLDILHRAPDKYELYRHKALMELRKRELKSPVGEKIQFAVEKLFLYDNDWIQQNLFNTHANGVYIQPMLHNDIPKAEEIFRIWSVNTPPYLLDDTHQERWIRPLMELEPSAFNTIWFEGELIGFFCFVPLNESTRPVFQQNPPYTKYIEQTKLKEGEFVVWIGAILPEYEREAMDVLCRQFIVDFAKAKHLFGIGYYTYYIGGLLSLGFERIPSADYRADNGENWVAMQLNLKDSDFLNLLDKIFESAMGKYPAFSKEDIKDFVKKALVHFESLEQENDILERFIALLPGNLSNGFDKGGNSLAAVLSKYLLDSLEEMKADGKGEKELIRIIQLAYIDKIGPHGVIANRLNLSISTYYRYLKKATEKLTLHFCQTTGISNSGE